MARKCQYEDNATNVLIAILNGKNKAKAKLIFNFLTQHLLKIKSRNKYEFDDLTDISARETLKDTKPDITFTFNNGTQYKIEVKDKDSNVTEAEKDDDKRDVFLIPKDYKYSDSIPKKTPKLFWEDLFIKIDEEFGGECFPELNLTREYLDIKSKANFDSYTAKALAVFCYLTNNFLENNLKIKVKEINQIWQETKDQGLWITITESLTKNPSAEYLFTFDRDGVYIEFKNDKLVEEFIQQNHLDSEYKFYESDNKKTKTIYKIVYLKNDFLLGEEKNMVNHIFDEFIKFKKDIEEKIIPIMDSLQKPNDT